jgi:hypothetical protein
MADRNREHDVSSHRFPINPVDAQRITTDELKYRFQFHPADSQNRKDAHSCVRLFLLEAADKIVEVTGPPSREQSTAITKLEEAMFWANAAIARSDGPRT